MNDRKTLASREALMSADPPGYLFLREEHVPPRGRRGSRFLLIPLLPEEASSVLAGEEAVVLVEPEDEELARLLAQGTPVAQIAREFGRPLRSVQRRVGRLRERFGVRTTTRLVAELARRGFRAGGKTPSGDAGN